MSPPKRGDRDFPGMPKRQPCPNCRKNCERVAKTMGGANYRCPNHGSFFVRAWEPPDGTGRRFLPR